MTSAGSITALASSAAILNSGVMQAVQNINLTSGIGSITNNGTITATMGNININSLIQNNVLNNLSGLLQASNGSINIGSAQSALQNISINGGNFIADEINVIAPSGEINAMLGTVEGTLRTTADVVHVGSSTENLTLGEITCIGDPTYFNDLGDITITGNISVGEALAIIARNNINIAPNVTITAQDGVGQGYPVYLVAGVLITTAGAPTATITGAPPVIGNSLFDVTISEDALGNQTGGGNIIFQGNSTISSASTCAGATTTPAAYLGTVASTNGRIDMFDATSSIDAGGGAGGNNGVITLMAGGAAGGGFSASILSGTLTSNSGSAGTGSINLYTGQPRSSDATPSLSARMET